MDRNNPFSSSYCSQCPVGYKIKNCCGKNPGTRRSEILKIGGSFYKACPSLSEDGSCGRYPLDDTQIDTRPKICQTFKCGKMKGEEQKAAEEGLRKTSSPA